MGKEIEAKFKVAGFAGVRKLLRAAGAEFLGAAVQTDRYFDTSDGSLRKNDSGLRIRTARSIRKGPGEDLRALLTCKGPRRKNGRLKVRRETQTHVEDGAVLAGIFRDLGLRVTATVEKRRWSYRLGSCRIELDQLPGIGRFVEIEAQDEKTVRRACETLGLQYQPITATYPELLSASRPP